MDAQETLGVCLGFQMLKTRGVKETLTMTLIADEGEEELPYPQTMLLYALDGKIRPYQIFTRKWRNDKLTIAPEEVKEMPASVNAAPVKKMPASLSVSSGGSQPAQMPASINAAPVKKMPAGLSVS